MKNIKIILSILITFCLISCNGQNKNEEQPKSLEVNDGVQIFWIKDFLVLMN
jgi:heme/copper-type cytochrome/quinol oxidase subunit 2